MIFFLLTLLLIIVNQLCDAKTIPPIEDGVEHEPLRFGMPISSSYEKLDNFLVSYNSRTRLADWVMENITAQNVSGRSSKSITHLDGLLRKGLSRLSQGFSRMNFNSAQGHHFVLKQITPEAEYVQEKWAEMDAYVRRLIKRSHVRQIHTCAGPLFLAEIDEVDKNFYVTYRVTENGQVAVPTHLFNVILIERTDDLLELECYIFPNEKISADVALKEFVAPFERIERSSGAIIFEQMPHDRIAKINGNRTILDGERMPTVTLVTAFMRDTERAERNPPNRRGSGNGWRRGSNTSSNSWNRSRKGSFASSYKSRNGKFPKANSIRSSGPSVEQKVDQQQWERQIREQLIQLQEQLVNHEQPQTQQWQEQILNQLQKLEPYNQLTQQQWEAQIHDEMQKLQKSQQRGPQQQQKQQRRRNSSTRNRSKQEQKELQRKGQEQVNQQQRQNNPQTANNDNGVRRSVRRSARQNKTSPTQSVRVNRHNSAARRGASRRRA